MQAPISLGLSIMEIEARHTSLGIFVTEIKAPKVRTSVVICSLGLFVTEIEARRS
jgi:hypothetical protein